VVKEPMGPAVKQGDEQWFSIVRYTLMALINAEELGLSSVNVDELRDSPSARIRMFLGLESDLGQSMGLSADWAYRIVRQVGNYGEIFERNVGSKSIFKLDRGFNDLWLRGGLMYSPPFR
jgi:general L-amino acid transport system substrate-binding protein